MAPKNHSLSAEILVKTTCAFTHGRSYRPAGSSPPPAWKCCRSAGRRNWSGGNCAASMSTTERRNQALQWPFLRGGEVKSVRRRHWPRASPLALRYSKVLRKVQFKKKKKERKKKNNKSARVQLRLKSPQKKRKFSFAIAPQSLCELFGCATTQQHTASVSAGHAFVSETRDRVSVWTCLLQQRRRDNHFSVKWSHRGVWLVRTTPGQVDLPHWENKLWAECVDSTGKLSDYTDQTRGEIVQMRAWMCVTSTHFFKSDCFTPREQ